MKSCRWMSDNREAVMINGQAEIMLQFPQELPRKFLYLQVSIQTVEGCKISSAWGRLNVTGGRTEPVHDSVKMLGLVPG